MVLTNIRAIFFSRRTTKQENRLPGRVVQSLSLEVFRIPADKAAWSHLIGDLALSSRLDYMTPKIPANLTRSMNQ